VRVDRFMCVRTCVVIWAIICEDLCGITAVHIIESSKDSIEWAWESNTDNLEDFFLRLKKETKDIQIIVSCALKGFQFVNVQREKGDATYFEEKQLLLMFHNVCVLHCLGCIALDGLLF
jgi:hypothetical protein